MRTHISKNMRAFFCVGILLAISKRKKTNN